MEKTAIVIPAVYFPVRPGCGYYLQRLHYGRITTTCSMFRELILNLADTAGNTGLLSYYCTLLREPQSVLPERVMEDKKIDLCDESAL